MQPATCCVAPCHVSTAWHLLLRGPGGGRAHRVQPLSTTAARSAVKMPKTGNSLDETSRRPFFSGCSSSASRVPTGTMLLLLLFPSTGRTASQQGGWTAGVPGVLSHSCHQAESHRKSPLPLTATPTTRTDRFWVSNLSLLSFYRRTRPHLSNR